MGERSSQISGTHAGTGTGTVMGTGTGTGMGAGGFAGGIGTCPSEGGWLEPHWMDPMNPIAIALLLLSLWGVFAWAAAQRLTLIRTGSPVEGGSRIDRLG